MIITNVDTKEDDPTRVINGDEDEDLEGFEDEDDDDPFSQVDPSDER